MTTALIEADDEISFADAARMGRCWSEAEWRAVNSMVNAEPANALVSAFKPAENGEGYIVRLREMEGEATRAALRVPALGTVKRAWLCNGVEDVLQPLPVENGAARADLGPWDILTIRVE